MSDALQLGKYSIGVGDRFAHQARAQLQSCIEAAKAGVEVIPVWNKSNREHRIVGSNPRATRFAADAATAAALRLEMMGREGTRVPTSAFGSVVTPL